METRSFGRTDPMRRKSTTPHKIGLYRPEARDACGVGFVAQLDAPPSHEIVELALGCLDRLTHRGGVDADGVSGDGAGVLTQLPREFFVEEARKIDSKFNPAWQIAAGVFFLPRKARTREKILAIAEKVIESRGLQHIGWREVPLDPKALGPQARETRPHLVHMLVAQPAGQEREYEQTLYLVRKEIERRAAEAGLRDFYIASFSSRTIVYKGLMAPSQLGIFYQDLQSKKFVSSAALFHQRYSTNTSPSWELAQPFRMVGHNGEINTLLGNRNWMKAREAVLEHPVWGTEVEWLKPVLQLGGSDSADFDNALELLTRSGRTVHHALLMMIPEAWENSVETSPNVKAFYHYHACLMEPWDGPAAVAFLDGPLVGAALDRNGLRPARYTITHDGLVVLGSEVGLLDLEPERIKEKGRLGPGQILLVDLEHHKILKNEQVKRTAAHGHKYLRWNMRELTRCPRLKPSEESFASPEGWSLSTIKRDRAAFTALQRAAGFTEEDADLILRPMAGEKKEPVGSMGDDTPLAALSHRPRMLYDYFRQMFAQVTNPAIDPLRESLVMSLNLYLGARHSVLVETPKHASLLHVETPFLFNEELVQLKRVAEERFKPATISTLFHPAGGGAAGIRNFRQALGRIIQEATTAVAEGSTILILSDRGVSSERAAVPMLLVTAGIAERLVAEGMGNRADLVIETAEAWESHHLACLLSFGAAAVNPYMALEAVAELAWQGEWGDLGVDQAVGNFRTAVEAGIKKILSKMGISTLASYQGGKFFEIIGLEKGVVDRFFPETRSAVGGRTLADIAIDVLERHANAYLTPRDRLEFAGIYRFRKGTERHAFSPDVVRNLHKVARRGDSDAFHKFTELVDQREPIALRDLFRFASLRSIPLEEVEPVESIWKRFSTQAMSLGALSPETQRTLAMAMNEIGGKSNTGEGGEDPDVYIEIDGVPSASHKIKQVASGRFGVTPDYLVRAEELEIKMAQGSKPGEGGQLPGHKVTPLIARVRRAVEGIPLISPPPHHDIYSIEDLAQLIYDLREINPAARICVKLVSQSGVGTVACGVVKADSDVVLISGHDGGTGASPLGSIKNTASPWEMGLAETHQALLSNGLRSRVRLRVDGGIKTGRDVLISALLGADEFGFGTGALVALGCVMARQCHLNTCPVGVATQREELRAKFPGKTENLISYFRHVGEQVRELLAQLGFHSLDEVIGRTDLVRATLRGVPGRRGRLDPRPILAQPPLSGRQPAGTARKKKRQADLLALQMCEQAQPLIESGPAARGYFEHAIRNVNRAIGARVSGDIARRFGNDGLSEGLIEYAFKGSAGQSFGAFLTPGLRLVLEGEANDYVGKGLGGGEIIVRPPPTSKFYSQRNVIIGNAVLYGATGGRLFAAGRAGERFCIRNSGAVAVVEGTGDHGCEYMTGGVAVILGETGRNFGAGMTNGVAFVWDPDDRLEKRSNPELVTLERIIEPEDSTRLRTLVEEHAEKTASTHARRLLKRWSDSILDFWKVVPLSQLQKRAMIAERLETEPTLKHTRAKL